MKAAITLLLVLFTSIATFGQTTETRYYNGKYTKETALNKANDFFNLKNGEKITFTKMDKKSDYQFIGNWIIKGEAENLQSKIEYLFEDNGLKIKINEIVLNDKYGALRMDKNHQNEALRKTAENLYVSINDLFVKTVFAYLDIDNNTTPTNNTANSASANNTAGSANEIAEKPGASFNPQLPLYEKEVSNNVFYFYQNNKRIQDPIFHQTTSMHKNKGVHCYYKADKDYYFYVPGTENPNAEGKYKMYGLRGRYVFTKISKDEQKFVFEGKLLQPQEYDLIVSRKKDCLLLLKENGLMFEIPNYAFPKQNETVTHTASNSDALGSNSSLFIVFKENGEMVVAEKGKVQPKADWKIINEDDKNFLINNVDGRKYRVGIYNLTAIGIIAPNAINLVK